jgi:cytochrome P450
MSETTLLDQVFAYENRHDPYPLFAELRKTPVAQQPDGTFVVSGYEEIVALLHDPRVSSDPAKRGMGSGNMRPGFINTDPPTHDRLRREATSFFGPPHRPDLVASLESWMHEAVNRLIDGIDAKSQVDIVNEVAYPFPVSVICRVLGVPTEDEPKFHEWSGALIEALSVRFQPEGQEEVFQKALTANQQLIDYLTELAAAHRKDPGDDVLSGLATDEGPDRLEDEDIPATARLLLIAGHETTVNLIANGMLTFLRHPEELERVRSEPEYIIRVVEELLRFEPPVQLVPNRSALEDIPLGESTIPAGSGIILATAAGNRDPARFANPDVFDPERQDGVEGQHLGLGGGVHYCFGAPLARLEVQIALQKLAQRLENPRLVQDPPEYRPSPILRGPLHLPVDIDGVRPAFPPG